ncbi:MAG: DHH family phosphoesterase, partial [Candidatus Aenigmatarchaeota archaeon]
FKGATRILSRYFQNQSLIWDHHIYEKNLDSKEILHLNPRFREKKAYMPTAYMIYRILEKMDFDGKSFCWIAAMGIIGDYAFEDCKDLLNECKKEYPYLLEKHPLDSKLSEGADLITYSVIIKGFKGAGESLKVLLKSLDYEEFAKNKKLQRWKEEMKREFDFIVKDAEKEEHKEIGLLIYKIKTRFNVTSLVATHFSEKYPDKIVMVRKGLKDGWKLCLRNQSGRINLGNVVKKCVKGIGSGGGHEKAAGVMTANWKRFKKRFISSLSAS